MLVQNKTLTDGARRSEKDVDGFVDPHVDGVAERLLACTSVIACYHTVITQLTTMLSGYSTTDKVDKFRPRL